MRTLTLLVSALMVSLSANAQTKKASEKKADALIVPEVYSFKTVNSFDGKLGVSTLFLQAQPFGAMAGYINPFAQLDWDGIAETPFSAHIDFDGRFPILEPRDITVLGRDGEPNREQIFSDGAQQPADYYRSPGTFASGRFYSWYMRINELYGEYGAGPFQLKFGRFLLRQAAQNQVDGVNGAIGFGAHEVGAFAGLKSNPFHQRIVGATTGYVYDDTGELFPPGWGKALGENTVQGRFANNLLNFGSSRFQTAGLYTSLQFDSTFIDASVTGDFFDGGIDRVWIHSSGGARFLKTLTFNYRMTLDVIGAQPYLPRDVMLDASWRDLGPFDVSLTYTKFNTLSTAQSFNTFFRPLEDPQGVLGVEGQDPFLVDRAAQGLGVDDPSPLLVAPLNNTQLFLVNRDRINFEIDWEFFGSLEVYGRATAERRGDSAFVPGGDTNLFHSTSITKGLCSYDDATLAPGINSVVPVNEDLCKIGGTLGLRDPFLGGYGMFDIHATHLNGFFQSTSLLAGRAGVALGEALWLELGAQIEFNESERVFVGSRGAELLRDPDGPDGPIEPNNELDFYTAQDTTALVLDGSISWNIFYGATLQTGYYGFIEEVPFQGDTFSGADGGVFPRIETQTMHQIYARMMWRF